MPLLPCAYAHGYKDVGAMRLFAQTHVFAGDPFSAALGNLGITNNQAHVHAGINLFALLYQEIPKFLKTKQKLMLLTGKISFATAKLA